MITAFLTQAARNGVQTATISVAAQQYIPDLRFRVHLITVTLLAPGAWSIENPTLVSTSLPAGQALQFSMYIINTSGGVISQPTYGSAWRWSNSSPPTVPSTGNRISTILELIGGGNTYESTDNVSEIPN